MNIFISANNTDRGKTYSTLKLIEKFSKLGYKVGVMKPIETGVKDVPLDGKKLFEKAKEYNPNLKSLSLEDIVPIRHSLPAAPYVSGEVDFEKIKKSYEKIKPLCDILLIEGAGGILVPVCENFYMMDFLKFFNAKLFLVIGSKLGMINDFLLNKYYLESNKIPFTWAINLFDEKEYFEISHPFLKIFNPLFIQKDLDKIAKKLLGD
ncbi:dethiobiotin synthase [Caminibacter pacificus]|uniref:ATP-dependent dethiobiotin synthetase BioD n=1 Tax=Caminibacter pacificus TaxID=1424653 RepID=A0AAJ4RCX6_9BACT|nr:dethiobiotin synthase [Caminibacter pacificus]QCI27592.1 dethiobiotin synthase [Caminibacter pacificus]ROR40230.1 dethiobiotin synthetase [Caminibacter pacificus]